MTIRWPFVSREHHDDAVALWRRLADTEHENAQALRQENADLSARYHALANPVATMTTPAGVIPLERAEPSEVTKVIREQCETADGRTDHALARHLRGYAKQLKRAGKTDDEIVAALVAWQSSEPASHVAEAVG